MKNIAEDRRDSLYFRNTEGKFKRDFQAEVNADKCHRVHESYELKWADERDADEYREKFAKEQRDNPDALIAKGKEILAAAEKLAKKEQSHAEIEKRLKESEALSNQVMKKLSEKQRIIQEQAKLIKEKEKESSTDTTSAKDKAILADAEKLEQKERAYAEMAKRLDDTEALSTQAANDLSGGKNSRASKANRIRRKRG